MPAPEPPGRSARSYLRALVAAVLVLVVAAGVYARAHTSFEFRPVPQLSSTAVTVAFLAVEALGVVFLVLAIIMHRRRRPPPEDDEEPAESQGSRWIGLAVTVALLAMVLLLLYWLLKHFRSSALQPPRVVLPTPGSVAATPHGDRTLPDGAGTLWLVWLGVVVLAIAVIVTLALWRRRRARAVPPVLETGVEPVPDPGGDAMRAGRRALDTSADPRDAVIACYEAMERSLADAGLARTPAQTPEELLALARGRDAVVSARAAGTLVELFGRARFSSRTVDASDVTRARNALAELLAETPDRARA